VGNVPNVRLIRFNHLRRIQANSAAKLGLEDGGNARSGEVDRRRARMLSRPRPSAVLDAFQVAH
jgi:hypothetical protein